MHRVFTAQYPLPFTSHELKSGMYVVQRQFPDYYDDRDLVTSDDHDRCIERDFDHATACCKRHLGTGELTIGRWAQTAKPEAIIAFIKDITKIGETNYKDVVWIGFRILESTHRANGYPVFSLQLFAKHPDSNTKVYSGCDAPNVEQQQIEGYQYKDGTYYLSMRKNR